MTPNQLKISIHAPRMGSDKRAQQAGAPIAISIHAPRMGSDELADLDMWVLSRFQSTLPGWGATVGYVIWLIFGLISIHAPRMGSD